MSQLLRVAEAARILGVSEMTVRRWADSGKLPALRLQDGERLFAVQAVQALSERRSLVAKS